MAGASLSALWEAGYRAILQMERIHIWYFVLFGAAREDFWLVLHVSWSSRVLGSTGVHEAAGFWPDAGPYSLEQMQRSQLLLTQLLLLAVHSGPSSSDSVYCHKIKNKKNSPELS